MRNGLTTDPFGNQTIVPKFNHLVPRNTDDEIRVVREMCPADVLPMLGLS
jgi:hypothetical protein